MGFGLARFKRKMYELNENGFFLPINQQFMQIAV